MCGTCSPRLKYKQGWACAQPHNVPGAGETVHTKERASEGSIGLFLGLALGGRARIDTTVPDAPWTDGSFSTRNSARVVTLLSTVAKSPLSSLAPRIRFRLAAHACRGALSDSFSSRPPLSRTLPHTQTTSRHDQEENRWGVAYAFLGPVCWYEKPTPLPSPLRQAAVRGRHLPVW